MPIYGRYETVREYRRGGLGVVFAARADGDNDGEPSFAIKAVRPAAQIMGVAAAAEQVEQFVAQAQRQQELVQGGADHWVPVHDVGSSDGVGYVVTDLYPRSAETLIRGHAGLDSAGLFNIVESVIAGLVELQSAAGRPHGRLKPSNVLMGEGAFAEASVFLTDAVEVERLRPEADAAADLRAVGELIHQLVTHDPVRTVGAASVADDPKWRRLGRKATAWRALCQGLLDPGGANAVVTLDETRAALEPLREADDGWKVSKPLVAALAFVVVGGIVAAVLLSGGNGEENDGGPITGGPSSQQELTRLCLALYDSWYSNVLDQSEELVQSWASIDFVPEHLGEIAKNPSKFMVTQVGSIELADFRSLNQEKASVAWNEYLLAREGSKLRNNVNRAYNTYKATEDAIGEWLKTVDDEAKVMEGAGLTSGGALRQAIAPALGYKRSGSGGFELDMIAIVNETVPLAGYLDHRAVLDAKAAELASATDDPIVMHATEVVDNEIEGWTELQLPVINSELEKIKKTFEKVHSVLSGLDSRIAVDVFREKATVFGDANRDGVDRAILDRWVDEVDGEEWTRLPEADDPRRNLSTELATQSETLNQEIQKIEEVDGCNETADGAIESARNELTRLELAIRDLDQLDWIGGRRGTIETSVTELASQISTLPDGVKAAYEYCTGEAEKCRNAWVTAANSDFSSIEDPTLENGLADAVRDIHDEAESDHQACRAMEAIVQRYDDFEAVLEKVPFDPPDGNSADVVIIRAAFESERNEVIRGFTEGDKASFEMQVEPLREWQTNVSELARGYGRLREVLDAGYGLDEPADALTVAEVHEACTSSAVYVDVADAFQEVDGRVEALHAIAAAQSFSDLQPLVDGTAFPERPWAVWRRIDDVDGMSLTELLSVGGSVREVAGAAGDIERQGTIETSVDDKLRTAWQEAARAAGDEGRIRDLLRRRDQYAVSEADLSPAMRYNIERIRLADLGTSGDDNAELQDISSRLAEIDLPQARALATAIDADLIGRPSFNLAGEGPGRAGLPVQANGDDSCITYMLGDIPLEFVRVQAGERTAYIATEEVSVAVFKAILQRDRAVRNDVLNSDEKIFSNDDAGVGPRVWHSKQLRTPRSGDGEWFFLTPELEGMSRFYAGESPDAPTEEHPMQYIPAEVALVAAASIGCRLPSVREWQAARNASGETMQSPSTNLRDQTWKVQMDYAKSVGIPELEPSDGGFFPPRSEAGTEPHPGIENDGVLWFRKTSEGGAGACTLKNLIGNVSEFVLPGGNEDAVTANASMDDVDAIGRACLVIGGSAQSPPSQSVDQPCDQGRGSLTLRRWSDVGFRLAFTGQEGLESALQSVLASHGYAVGGE